MRSHVRRILISAVATWATVVGITGIGAQQAVPAPPAASRPAVPAASSGARAEEAVVPLRIELSLSRHRGEKRISNLPFTMLTTVGQNTRLRVGSSVPINAGIGSAVNVNYQPVGTNIDALVHGAGVGRYRLDLRIEDSSVAEPPGSGQVVVGAPVIR